MSRTYKISKYEELTFEECVRIIYYAFSSNAGALKGQLAELLVMQGDYHTMIAPTWYEGYKSEIQDK